MQLIANLLFLLSGVIIINSAPFDEKLKPGSQEVRDNPEESAVHHISPIIPLLTSGNFIKARRHGFCVRRLSFSPG